MIINFKAELNYLYINRLMPLLKSTFSISKSIPIIGGEWGPFVNPYLNSSEKKQLFILFIVSLLLILIFGAIAYYSNKLKSVQPADQNIDPPGEFTVSYFLGFEKLVDLNSLMVGMGAGIVFGLIDNGGLWFGMNSLDNLFESANVPWIYGNGGKRPFSGTDSESESVYYGVKFKDGVLKRGDKIGIRTPDEICKKIQDDYDKVEAKIENDSNTGYEKFKQREGIRTNEAAFADPNSPLFLGHNMSKKDFFKNMVSYNINESTYNTRIDNYRDYINNKNLPTSSKKAEEMGTLTAQQRKLKLKYKKELKSLESLRFKNLGFPTQKYKDKVNYYKQKIKEKQVWPGKNKNLAQSWIRGWKPGKLTQAGIGNTYSDFLGSFLATFVGVLILNMSNISNVSILSEIVGIVIGCLLGIALPRLVSNKT